MGMGRHHGGVVVDLPLFFKRGLFRGRQATTFFRGTQGITD